MPRIAARTLDQLHKVLGRFGVTDTEIHDIRTGRVNKHWRVEAADRRYALRRYTHQRTPAAIDYEHDVLRHMERLGWPVAVPVPARDGAATVSAGGRTYALFRYLPGRLAPRSAPYYLRANGALLARLHADLATYADAGPRDGIGRLTDLDAWVPATDGRDFDQVLADYAREQPRLAAGFARWRETSVDELDRLGYHDLPNTLIHGDFHTNNIFFERRRLAGLLDFDFVRPDNRLADLALTIALAPPASLSLEPGDVATLVAAYHAESPLREPELRLIVPTIRAYYLWLCLFSLLRWLDGEANKATRSLTRSLDQRLPNLEARANAIETALRSAT